MRRSPGLVLATAATAGAMLAGCGTPAEGSTSDDVSVVVTTTIWGDIAGDVVACAGEGTVATLVPVGADPHDYAPSSQDIVDMVTADLVVANGLGLEEGLSGSIEAAAADGATVYEVGPDVDPMPLGGSGSTGHTEQDGTDEDEAARLDDTGADPHVWLDAARAGRGAAGIGSALADVTGDPSYAECGERVQTELDAVDKEVIDLLDAVEDSRRVLVTDHDALGYFADAYGFRVAGTVVPGGSTLAEPSSEELAALADTVRAAGVPAIFANTSNPQALVAALADEVGDVAVVDLYIGSLSAPDAEAATYAGLMTTNARRIADALAG